MAQRDYARSGSKSNGKKSSGGNGMKSGMLIFLVGLIAGTGVGWWVRGTVVGNAKELVEHAKSVNAEDKAKTAKTDPSKASVNEKYKPLDVDPQTKADWSFEELLEEKTATAPRGTNTTVEPRADENKSYVLACASFTEKARAETMKAQIALTGLQAQINPVESKAGKTFYRVQLGPYNSKRDAERDKHKLQAGGMNDCKIW